MRTIFSSIKFYDTNAFIWLNHRQHSQPIKIASRWISRSGDGYLYLALGTIAAAFDAPTGKLFLMAGLLAFTIELPIYLSLKHLFKRNRPFVTLANTQSVIKPADKFSMPSGHSAAASLMATLIIYYYPFFFVIAIVWASLIGLSRVTLGVHYPSDIIAGMGLGIMVANITLVLIG